MENPSEAEQALNKTCSYSFEKRKGRVWGGGGAHPELLVP